MNLDSPYSLHQNQYPEIGSVDMRRKIGEELRSAREFHEMTIDQVRAITKINTPYLEAIENGAWSFLPPVYVKLFVRAFAEAVKLHSEDFNSRLNEIFASSIKQQDHLVEVSDFFDDMQGDLPERGLQSIPAWTEKNKSMLVTAGISLVVIVLVLWYLLHPSSKPPIPSEEVTPSQTEMLAPANQSGVVPTAADTSLDTVKVDTTAVAQNKTFTFNLYSTQNCYVKVEYQDSVLYDRTLWPGNTLNMEFPDPVKVTLGNAPAVRLILNGDTLPKFTERKVKVFTFGSAGIQ